MKLRSGVASALLLTALLLSSQTVKTTYDPKFDFSQIHTFAVKIGTEWGDAGSQQHVKEAITRDLTAKGWTQADEATCDALVVLHGANQKAQTFQAFYTALPYYGWHTVGAPGLADSDHFEYHAGTLVVDIFAAKSKRAIFRAVGEGELSGDPGKIDKATQKMFSNFPPKTGG
ncbi:MAG TPA: DUF4136 domain-containing protein [Terriglobales bacterium]|nr:DUF4136 domain-containing protein [Terriglobales bacterium]